AVGRTLEQLGFASSEMELVKLLAQPRRTNAPWHGRVVVTQPGFDRRVCDCTVTGLQGLGSTDLLVALYDRTDELRAQRELIARRADTTPTTIPLNDLVRDVAEIRQRVLRADGVDVRTDIDTNVAPVLGLGQELMQVVINLVTNAEHAVRGRDPAVIRLVTQ